MNILKSSEQTTWQTLDYLTKEIRLQNEKIDTLFTSSSSADYNVINLIETWLVPSTANTEFMDARFSLIRTDRCDTEIAKVVGKGAGVLLGVNSNIKYDEYSNEKMTSLGATCIRIPLSSGHDVYIYSL